ncbi:glycosyltransferase family protein [Jiulongibacter sp. NS-SX5]|uniref:glycosyltransferase family protein n=1 Tax=Jiulongibacter sp. NS-SX5 TaxID=3463854 RepID=UPI00405A0440
MRLLLVVQGEGRGHLTQALSLFQQLKSSSHEVVSCLIGRASADDFTGYVEQNMDVPVHYFESPTLAYKAKGKGLSIKDTAFKNLRKSGTYVSALRSMHHWVHQYEPDLIINFYDLLCGLYQLRYARSAPPMVCIAHQYLLLHPQFEFPQGKWIDKFLINLNSRLTALRARKLFALSFTNVEKAKKIVSVPPLIRNEVMEHQTGELNYYLAYMTNPDLLQQLADWHLNHQDLEFHCFIKTEQEGEVCQWHKNLFVHKLNASKFLRLMANAKALITTAGFESVCEAIYFDKPIMMVPVPNHFEQACNAHDAQNFGAGIAQQRFELEEFFSYLKEHKSPSKVFRNWLNDHRDRIISELDLLELSLN